MPKPTRMSQPTRAKAGHFAIGLLAGLSLLAGCAHAQPVTLSIDPSTTYQSIDGFGASGGWWAQDVGGWEPETVDAIVNLLYGEQGAHLSVYRYNLGAGSGNEIRDPWRRTHTIPKTESGFDFSADANALYVLDEINQLGVPHIEVFVNSPPAELTVSGMVSGGPDGGENLAGEDIPAFAEWVVERTLAIRDRYGLTSVWLSPINEPQWDWGGNHRRQEGTYLEPDTAVAVLRAVGERLDARPGGDEVKLIGPEAGEWGGRTREYLAAVLDDEYLRERVFRLAVHSYFSEPEERRALDAWLAERGRPIPVLMSEWCQFRRGQETTMDSALTLAQTMHLDLTEGYVTGWNKWIAVSKYSFHDGLIYVDPEDQSYATTKRLWVMGQYSRFVRPGAVRIAATLNNDPPRGLYATAYRAAEDTSTAVVLTNRRDENIEIQLAGVDASAVRAWGTDATRDIASMPIRDNTITLPRESVVTVIIQD